MLTLLRLAVAAALPLSPDEAYYWVWSRALAWGYPDHPPMVALWIAAGTALAGDGAFGVRLLAPLGAAFGSLALADAARCLFPGKSMGARAAVLLNATLLLGVGSVTMTPDTPLLLFWTLVLWALARLATTGDGRWWFAAGAMAGLACLSKYTAALLAPAVLVWLLAVPSLRPWLRRPQPWLAALLAGLLFLPVVLWNARHGWVSLLRQGGRAGDWQPTRAVQFLAELVGGQAGLATPVLAALFAAGGAVAVRRAAVDRSPGWALLAALSAVPAAVFVQHALGDRVQANWPGICYPALAVAAAALGPGWQRWRKAGAALGFLLTALVWVQGAWQALPLPRRLDPTLMRLAGWPALAADVARAARRADAGIVAADNYGIAAELARLLPPTVTVVGLDPRWAYFRLPPPAVAAAAPVLLVRSARLAPSRAPSLVPAGEVIRARGGVPAEAYRLYTLPGLPADAKAAILPRPRGAPDVADP